jgi:membrane-bound metal-dependent hydrolase YbcI (DUF457 family)
MQAINHMAVALVAKKAVPATPLLGLLAATEAIEFLWVGLNLVGIEFVEIVPPGTHITDVELAHMPFSHSILSSVAIAIIVGIAIIRRRGHQSIAIAGAIAAAILSHILLDLAVHARDIPLMPFIQSAKYGSELGVHFPLTALLLETAFGLCCWWYFGGSKKLLAVFVFSAAIALPAYLPRELGIGSETSPDVFPIVILLQIVVTMFLVWIFARTREPLQDG